MQFQQQYLMQYLQLNEFEAFMHNFGLFNVPKQYSFYNFHKKPFNRQKSFDCDSFY